ncbi:MAG: S-layer homology domain-containing protein, partial [Bacillota bacterium]
MPRQRWLAMALVLALALALVPAPAAGETAAPAAPAAGDTTAPVAPEAGDTSAPAAPAAGNTSAPAAPAAGTDPAVAAAETLRALGIVTGDDRGLRLQDRITRAEIVTILVRASGLAYLEPLNREVYSFPDVAGHWSRGFVAVARSQGYIAGRGDGRFYPDAEVTHAEAVTLVVRLAGIEVTETDWPHNYFRAAEAAGILPMDLDLAAAPNQPALRGTVFRLVDAAMRVARDESGRNLYQRHHDAEAPTITLTAPTGPVEAAGAGDTVTVEGTVRENRRLARLEVAGIPVPVGEDGQFRVNVPVPADGNPIAVVATDAAGNVARVEIPVAAGPRPAAAIEVEVEGALELTVGESREVPVQVLDDRGQPIPDAALTGEVVGGIGTFDPETRTFTATRSGSGYL